MRPREYVEKMVKARWGKCLLWLDGFRNCTKCNQLKEYEFFGKCKNCFNGINSVCKECRTGIAKIQHKNNPVEKRLYFAAKNRSKKFGFDFNLDLSDVKIPKKCPIFNVPLTLSLDRIDSNKGYIKGNVQVISKRANMLKNNGSIEEFEKIILYLKTLKPSN